MTAVMAKASPLLAAQASQPLVAKASCWCSGKRFAIRIQHLVSGDSWQFVVEQRSFVGLCLRWAVEFNGVGWLGWMGKANESVYNVKLTMVLGFNLTVGCSCQASACAICRPIAAGTVIVVGALAA